MSDNNKTTAQDIHEGTVRIAEQLNEFCKTHTFGSSIPPAADTIQQETDLQLAVCRKLRELLPTTNCASLLQTAQTQHWIPVLLSWLNLHDRPAVQVEALLAVTNIAEVCANAWPNSKYSSAAVQAAANQYPYAAAAVAAAGGGTATPGSVPFPPLSFSQTLSPEAIAAFDASLSGSFDAGGGKNKTTNASSVPGINFTSLAPPPGGAHSTVPSNAFMPPPTPIANNNSKISFPQTLSASSQHLLLRHADAIPTLISLLSSPSREVYEQAAWILGSIAAGDSPGGGAAAAAAAAAAGTTDRSDKSVSARDVILAAGVMNQLLRCLEAHPENLSLQRIGSWTLSNLVDGIFQAQQSSQSQSSQNSGGGNSQPTKSGGTKLNGDYVSADEIEMSTLMPVLCRLLHMTDSEVLSYICWTLSHLCDGPASHIAAVVTSDDGKPGGLVPRLVELLVHPSWRVTKPALRTIGNIVCAECSDDVSATTNTDYTEVILECEAVPRLKELVTHNNREIQKEACWTLSNIAAGTIDQIQAVIDSGAIPPLVNLVRDKKTDQEVRSEACWVVLNVTSCGSDSQIEILVDEGCVSVLGVLLSEASMVMMALEGLERVLQVEETREMIRREQIENGEIEDEEDNKTPILVSASLIEKARESHNSSAVTKRADRIWKQHFVSCALCKKSFSKHRTSDASFCEECKCHVCHRCDCRIYHLDYQEELWAATEEKTEAKKNAKKSKNKKKKAKLKEKKAKQQNDEPVSKEGKDQQPQPLNKNSSEKKNDDTEKSAENSESAKTPPPLDEEEVTEADDAQNQIDLVLYLQQTGSIIALSKLMDALEYGGEDYDEELDDYERKMIREQQMMRGQPTN